MASFPRNNLAEQAAAFILKEISKGTWHSFLPGVIRLATELSVSKDTIREALRILETSGHIHGSRAGLRRKITPSRKSIPRSLRIGILLPEPLRSDNRHSHTLMLLIRESVERQGHVCFFAERSVQELGNKLARVEKMMHETPADAWILYGAYKNIAKWLVKESTPLFCIGGYSEGLPSFQIDAVSGIKEVTRDFIRNGHRRIVFIVPERWKNPQAVPRMQAFIDAMKEGGLPLSSYNIPDWDMTPAGLHRLLENLFRMTPPTGLLMAEPSYTMGVLSFLEQSGLRVPEDVSLFSLLSDPLFLWHKPQIATLDYTITRQVPCVLEWVDSLASGMIFKGSMIETVRYLPGESIGPVKHRKVRSL